MTPGSMRDTEVAHQAATSSTVGGCSSLIGLPRSLPPTPGRRAGQLIRRPCVDPPSDDLVELFVVFAEQRGRPRHVVWAPLTSTPEPLTRNVASRPVSVSPGTARRRRTVGARAVQLDGLWNREDPCRRNAAAVSSCSHSTAVLVARASIQFAIEFVAVQLSPFAASESCVRQEVQAITHSRHSRSNCS
jgi:hypothetical protein